MFASPSLDELAPHFPGYKITSLIAAGGMGAVYHAIQLSLNREVAIKILPAALSSRDEFRASFEAEARAMARLNHRNLITIYDFGTAGDLLFIIMEYVKGESLHQAARGVKIDPSQAVEIVLAVADGLAHAHKVGLVHRDVKPANILLNRDAVPQIGDFGLAAMSGNGALSMGTPGYLAPEVQAQPDLADKRSDIYSLGVILFELLTAMLPRRGVVSPSAYAKVSTELDRICATSLHPDPASRYQRVEDFVTDLKAWRTARYAPVVKPVLRTVHPSIPAKARKATSGATNLPKRNYYRIARKLVMIICLLATVYLAYQQKSKREALLTKHQPGKNEVQPVVKPPKEDLMADIPARRSRYRDGNSVAVQEKKYVTSTSENQSKKSIGVPLGENSPDVINPVPDSAQNSSASFSPNLNDIEKKKAWERNAKRAAQIVTPFVAVDAVNGSFHEAVKKELDGKGIRYKLLVSPITLNQLDGASVLVISGPFRGDLDKPGVGLKNHRLYTDKEIEAISTFVRDGGVLIGAGAAWPWTSEVYGNKKIEDYPLNQIGIYLNFRILDGYAKFFEYDQNFTKIIRVAKSPADATFSNVEMSGEFDKLILSSPNNTYCGIGAKRYFGYVYIFGHELPLQSNPGLVSAIFFATLTGTPIRDIEDMDIQFRKDLSELQDPLVQLLNQYLDELGLAKGQYQKAGNFEAALAHQQEIDEFRPKEFGGNPGWRAPEYPEIIKKRQEYMRKRSVILSRNYDAAIGFARGYADKLNGLVVERTKSGELKEAQAFQSRLDDLRNVMIIYREMNKSGVEMSIWVKETLERMPERPTHAGGVLPKLALVGTKAGEVRRMQLTKDVSMEFCWCPPGDFVMGSPISEQGRRENEKQVFVRITKGFWIGRYEVTQEQWRAVMGGNPSHFGGDKLPVEQVSWNEVQEFIHKLNQKIGVEAPSKVFLPTEAQWEYACRAGHDGPFSGGGVDEVAWYAQNSKSQSHFVGGKKPNKWGIYDMHGNVWEWCLNWYDGNLLGGIDPIGPSFGTDRVFRGGTWMNIASSCRAACRYGLAPSYRSSDVGFRIVRIQVEP